jgi:hypothetical protein
MTFLNKPWQFWFEWFSTALLISGVALTSFNVYPLNLYVLLVGNITWLLLAVIWKKSSLFVVQLIITLIYVVGIAKLFI